LQDYISSHGVSISNPRDNNTTQQNSKPILDTLLGPKCGKILECNFGSKGIDDLGMDFGPKLS